MPLLGVGFRVELWLRSRSLGQAIGRRRVGSIGRSWCRSWARVLRSRVGSPWSAGGRVWARLHAADIPATQTLAVLPRDLLLVEGLQTLLAPLLIGALGALLVYYSWPTEAERDRLEDRGRAEWKKRTAAEADHSKQKDGDDAPPGMEPPGADADQGKQGESDNVRREAEPPTTGPPLSKKARQCGLSSLSGNKDSILYPSQIADPRLVAISRCS